MQPPPPSSSMSQCEEPTNSTLSSRLGSYRANTVRVLRRHAYFVGPGIVASVAYADPGNWATDLQAGSEFGYSLLFIVLLTGIFAVFIQILSCRVGVVTNADLARQCRMLILKEDRHGRPPAQPVPHPKWRRWAILYPLYVICEGAIVATELAELTGSAIALNLLFPAIPLWAGILITSVDVLLILFVYRPPPNGSFRLLEAIISLLVFVVLSCFIVLLVRIRPRWPDVFHGYLPSHHVVQSGALYVSVGILGATVMPHAIILGSHFASIDRLPSLDRPKRASDDPTAGDDAAAMVDSDQGRWSLLSQSFARIFTPKPETKAEAIRLSRVVRSLILHRTAHADADSESLRRPRRNELGVDDLPPRTLENIRIHIRHASVDIGISLVSFAIVINSAILIVAAAAFYYTESGTAAGAGQVVVASLYDAFYLLKDRLGSLPAVLFAVALLAAGQSASITVTLAGQLVSEGFINWRTDPFIRRVVTRLVAVIPSLTVSLAVGKDGLDEMLVASQVALSIALPFVLLPLILVTGSKIRMTAREPEPRIASAHTASEASSTRSSAQLERAAADETTKGAVDPQERVGSTSASLALIETLPREAVAGDEVQESKDRAAARSELVAELATDANPDAAPAPHAESHCFASAWYVQTLAYAIFTVIVIADGYVLVTTFMGE